MWPLWYYLIRFFVFLINLHKFWFWSRSLSTIMSYIKMVSLPLWLLSFSFLRTIIQQWILLWNIFLILLFKILHKFLFLPKLYFIIYLSYNIIANFIMSKDFNEISNFYIIWMSHFMRSTTASSFRPDALYCLFCKMVVLGEAYSYEGIHKFFWA